MKRSAIADQNAALRVLKGTPGTWFGAAKIGPASGVPRKFVRRSLTVNRDSVTPIAGVSMMKRGGKYFEYSWSGVSKQP